MKKQKNIVAHSRSHVWLFVTPWTAAFQASLSFTMSFTKPQEQHEKKNIRVKKDESEDLFGKPDIDLI